MKKWVKIRAVANLLAILVCFVLIYIFLGSPAPTVEEAYRRAEKANLVGPGEILAVLEPQGQAYSHLVLARESGGTMVYAWDRQQPELREFVYREGSLVLTAAPGQEFFWLQTRAVLPVYLFHGYEEAHRAELELTIRGEFEGEAYAYTYSLDAQKEGEGWFAFTIRTSASLGPEGHGLSQLRSATGNATADLSATDIQALVRLYDAEDGLLAEETLMLT